MGNTVKSVYILFEAFNGRIISRHRTRDAAEKSAEKAQRQLEKRNNSSNVFLWWEIYEETAETGKLEVVHDGMRNRWILK